MHTARSARLTADATHRATGGDEVGLSDAMAGFFLPNHFFEIVGNIIVRSALAQFGPQVVLSDTEEAGANFSVGGQANSVAMAAEGLADRRDNSDFGGAATDSPAFGGFGWIVGRDW